MKNNEGTLSRHELWATGTTGAMLAEACPSLKVGRLDVLIFFTDPMSAQPHDVDVKALMRLSTVYNIVLALTRSTADFVIHCPLFERGDYHPVRPDYAAYIRRRQDELEAKG